MKHTPAPWEFKKFSQSEEEIALMKKHGMSPTPNQDNEGAVSVMNGETRIATVHCQTKAKKKSEQWKHICEERNVNAYLIAASPTLYEYAKKQSLNGCSEAKTMLDLLHLTE